MLSGKIAVVTGATRGIGKEIVYQYADSNAVVYAIGRDKKSLAEIDCYAENIHSLELDITQLDSVKKVLIDIYKKEKFKILTREEYIDIVCEQLELLRDDIVIMRITGDPIVDDLVEPKWLTKKFMVLNGIDKEMVKRNIYQGDKYGK